ncbi:MAG: AAA family ATPase [Bacteroidota bacterium]
MIIIGITGTLGAGKGTLVEYLMEHKGFAHYSVRSFLTEEINKRALPLDRDSMVLVANELRASFHPGYIAEQLFEQARQSGKNCIIESIRTPGEAELLKSKGNFFLLAVDANAEVRYERIRNRNSETDQVSLETFIENEAREMDSVDPNKQNIRKCIQMADFTLTNNSSTTELFVKLELILNQILSQ